MVIADPRRPGPSGQPRRVLQMQRQGFDKDAAQRLRLRRNGLIETVSDADKYSPFSPEALGVDLENIKPHPPTPNDEEIVGKGEIITAERVKKWPKDHRDRWRTNEPAYKQFALLEESFHRHKDKPIPVQGTVLHLPYGFYLLNSHMGSGKGVISTFYAAIFRAFGWSVVSTTGTKFGIHIGPSELYHFSLVCPMGAFIVADEIHAVFHSNTSGANREQSFQDNTTAMRKNEATFLGMSASKRIAPTYKAIVDWIGYVHPLAYDPRRDGSGWKETFRMVNWYGPKPYDRDDYEEEMGFKQSTNVSQYHEYFDSRLLMDAMKLFDSWAKVQTMFGDGYNADSEREDRQAIERGQYGANAEVPLAEDKQRIGRQIANWFAGGYFRDEEEALKQHEAGMPSMRRKAQTNLDLLTSMFGELVEANVPPPAIRRALESLRVPVTQRGNINIEDVRTLYDSYMAAGRRG